MIVLYTTFPSKQVAELICSELVNKKLIACANLFSAGLSIYQWEEKIEKTEECFALLKTIDSKIKEIEAFYKLHHPYETPCLIQISTDFVNQQFQTWVNTQIL